MNATHSLCTPLSYLDNSAAWVHDLGSRCQHRADRSRWTPSHDWTNALRLWRQFIAAPPIAVIENRTRDWMIKQTNDQRSALFCFYARLSGWAQRFVKTMPASLSHDAARGLTPSHMTIIIRLLHTKCLCA